MMSQEVFVLPLSLSQERLWFLSQLDQDSPAYNIHSALHLKGALDVAALERCLNEIVSRHESLRTTFAVVDEQPMQIIAESLHLTVQVVDLQKKARAKQQTRVLQLATEEAQQPFDLVRGPLIRAKLLRLVAEEHVLLATMHHIISDGWSWGIFFQELTTLYNAFVHRRPVQLAELPIQYADFAVWQRQWLQGQVLENQLTYWQRRLTDSPTLQLPTDHFRPAVQSYCGSRQSFTLAPSLTEALKALGRSAGVTLFMLLLAAFKTLLHRYSGQDDIIVGTDISGRNQETQNLIGFFVNELTLRTDLAGNPTFRELLERVRQVCLEAYAHQDLPFDRLVDALQPERDLSRQPLFQVIFTLHLYPERHLELSDLIVSPLQVDNGTAKFDLSLEMIETSQGLRGHLEYSTDLFETATITRTIGHFQTLLVGIVAHPDWRLSDLPILTAAEQHQLLETWNHTMASFPLERCFFELFEAQVERAPGAIAVVFENLHLTYRELNARANRLAQLLIEQRCGPNSVVALLAERSVDFLIAMLGVFKAGSAYLPLEPYHPAARLSQVLAQSASYLVLAERQFEPTLSPALAGLPAGSALAVLPLAESIRQAGRSAADDLHPRCAPSDLAYVIYTSGSTGLPKGAMVTHRGMLNHLLAKIADLELTQDDIIAQTASQCFDISVWQFLAALLLGGQVHVFGDSIAHHPGRLLDQVESQKVSVLETVPSMLQAMLEEMESSSQPPGLAALRWMIPTGEALPPELCRRWFDRYAAIPLLNAYGPTECSDDVTHYPIRQALEPGTVHTPIGRPIANTRLYVLDAHLQPTPVGVAGELYVGGICVGRGYLNDPQRTAQSFAPDPFASEPGARLYTTGDLVRYRADGNIEFLGRIDHQVKVRGYRIELGEIEAALGQHPGVREAVVLARDDLGRDKQLVAYVVARQGQILGSGELRRFLRGRLPEYMLPASFSILEAFPLTPNGKVDRKALPAPEAARLELEMEFVAPRTPLEEAMAEILEEVLGVNRVGAHNNFFELGGHSLLATQVVSRVRRIFQVELPLQSLFMNPTVAGLAASVEAARRAGAGLAAPPIEAAPRDRPLLLSFAQQRLWFLNQLEPESTVYNVSVGLYVSGQPDVTAMEWSLNEVVRRHEVLRTTFEIGDEGPVQIVAPELRLALPVVDLAAVHKGQRRTIAERLAKKEARQLFDLARGPLLRATLLRLADTEHLLLLVMHHIVSDAWSLGILARELVAHYQAFCAGQTSPLSELSIQYADFALWQRAWLQDRVLEELLAYWKRQLDAPPPALEFPTDRPHPPAPTYQGATLVFVLPATLADSLKALSRQQDVTLFMTLLAAFQALLYRYTSQEDIVVGSPIASRNWEETEGLIGVFINTLALRTDLSGDPTFGELLGRVREVTLGAYAHQDLPFEVLVDELQPERNLSHSPLFQTMFVLQNVPLEPIQLPELSLTPLEIERQEVIFDLALVMGETEQDLMGVWEYHTQVFDPATIERLRDHLVAILEAVVENSERRLLDISLLKEAERDVRRDAPGLSDGMAEQFDFEL